MRRQTPRIAFGLAAVVLALCGSAHGAAKAPVPEALFGTWTSTCAAGLPDRIDVSSDRVDVVRRSGSLTCRPKSQRSLSERRWYIDFACQDGSLLQLDLYLATSTSLLVAPRPLGEACLYRLL